MLAKPCPSCGLKNPASAATCDCGHSFGGWRLPGTAQLVCPKCREINGATAVECACGHSFVEDSEKVRQQLTHRLRASWFAIASGLLLMIGGVGLAVVQLALLHSGQIIVPTGMMMAGGGLIAKGSLGASRARAGLDTLGPATQGLPEARMLRK